MDGQSRSQAYAPPMAGLDELPEQLRLIELRLEGFDSALRLGPGFGLDGGDQGFDDE